jgi:TonB family protein
VVRGLSVPRNLSLASMPMAQPSQLESRVISILDSGRRRRTLSKTGTVLSCIIAAMLTASIAAIGIATAVPLPPVFVSSTKFTPGLAAAAPSVKPAAVMPQRTRPDDGNTVRHNAAIPPQILEPSRPTYMQEAVKENLEERPIRIGPSVTPPIVTARVDPEYTEEARQAKYQGTFAARVTVHKDGTLMVDEVLRELDYGLTQKAIEALEEWKFKPGMRNGEPVAVSLTVEVNFNLK